MFVIVHDAGSVLRERSPDVQSLCTEPVSLWWIFDKLPRNHKPLAIMLCIQIRQFDNSNYSLLGKQQELEIIAVPLVFSASPSEMNLYLRCRGQLLSPHCRGWDCLCVAMGRGWMWCLENNGSPSALTPKVSRQESLSHFHFHFHFHFHVASLQTLLTFIFPSSLRFSFVSAQVDTFALISTCRPTCQPEVEATGTMIKIVRLLCLAPPRPVLSVSDWRSLKYSLNTVWTVLPRLRHNQNAWP